MTEFPEQPTSVEDQKLPSEIASVLTRNNELFELPPSERNESKLKWADEIADKFSTQPINADNPLTSVVIPAYNEEPYILPLLSSIANSSITQPTEIIVVANNCTDATAELADRSGVRVVEYRDIKPAGVSLARKKGLEAAKGKYILTTDSDAIVTHDWIQAMTQPLIDDGNTTVVAGLKKYYTSDPFLSNVYNRAFELRFKFAPGNTPAEGKPTGGNMAYRRSDAMESGGYDVRKAILEDHDLATKLAKMGNLQKANGGEVWVSDRRLKDFEPLRLLYLSLKKDAHSIYLDDNGNMINKR